MFTKTILYYHNYYCIKQCICFGIKCTRKIIIGRKDRQEVENKKTRYKMKTDRQYETNAKLTLYRD